MYARRVDFLHLHDNLARRVRHLEITPSEGGAAAVAVRHYENWIVSPPAVRAYPVGFVTAGEIIGFRWSVPVGSIGLGFYHNGSLVHNAGTVSGTGGYTLPAPVAVADNDRLHPQISAVFSGASDATMSFLLSVS